MSTMSTTTATNDPFGIVVTADSAGRSLWDLDVDAIHEWATANRCLVLRDFALLQRDELQPWCERLGTVLEWEFGAVNDLQARPDAKNYIYTSDAVPLHFDGAFIGKIPRYIFFQCQVAPPESTGGETLLVDTTKVIARAAAEDVDRWERTELKYETEKVVHYGGMFQSKLVGRHPITGEKILRFAEPVHALNPVSVELITGDGATGEEVISEMTELLYNPSVCYAHSWRPGDIVIADNFSLLHGRRAFTDPAHRHIERVNIL